MSASVSIKFSRFTTWGKKLNLSKSCVGGGDDCLEDAVSFIIMEVTTMVSRLGEESARELTANTF